MIALHRRFLASCTVLACALAARAQTGVVQTVAPDVYFHQGDHSFVYCNNGWVVFDDYVLVVDANYPGGAAIVLPKLRATTPKPLRFVINTHGHPDHSFGNAFWAAQGALPVAHTGALEKLRKDGPTAWTAAAPTRPDVAASRLLLPQLTYSDSLVFADDHHRVELHWYGIAHTRGDTLVWLPEEKILFTGDLCVNGSYNFIGDSDTAGWIKVLDAAQALGAKIVCPGHGPIGGPEIVIDQQAYLRELRRGVHALKEAGKSAAEVKASVPVLAAELRKIPNVARYVPSDFWFTAHVDKVFQEMGGHPLPK